MVANDLPESTAGITVLCVDDDPGFLDFLESSLSNEPDLTVVTETDPETAVAMATEADCVVSDYAMPGMDGAALLEAVRENDPELPFVILSARGTEALQPIAGLERTEYVGKETVATAMSYLAGRIRELVEDRRAAAIARRSLTVADATQSGVAVAGASGRFTFVNRLFASRFGYDRDGLIGLPWRDLFADEEVDRLESGALSAARDGWRWTGDCDAIRSDGDRFTIKVAVVSLDDGSLAFVLPGPDE